MLVIDPDQIDRMPVPDALAAIAWWPSGSRNAAPGDWTGFEFCVLTYLVAGQRSGLIVQAKPRFGSSQSGSDLQDVA
jgi:hypothetical protein